MCIETSPEKNSTPDTTSICSLMGIQKGSFNYYKAKFEKAQEIIEQFQSTTPSLEDIDLLTVKKSHYKRSNKKCAG